MGERSHEKGHRLREKLYITTHVHDFMNAGNNTQDAARALKDLKSRFKIKKVPEFRQYLGSQGLY